MNPAQRWLSKLPLLGIPSPEELLLYLPVRYQDFTRPVTVLRDAMLGEKAYFILRVLDDPQVTEGSPPRLSFTAEDATHDVVRITVFGALYPWVNIVKAGEDLHVYGHLDMWKLDLQLNNPLLVPPRARNRVIPVYRGKPRVLSADLLRDKMREQLAALLAPTVARICRLLHRSEPEIVRQAGVEFEGLADLIRAIHHPHSLSEAERALEGARRLAAFQIVHSARQTRDQAGPAAAAIPVGWDLIRELVQGLPYGLTLGQKRAIRDIVEDLRLARPMRRLLSADIGFGKTVVYAVAAAACQRLGRPVAILVPNTLLVDQTCRDLREWFPELPVQPVVGGSRIKVDFAQNPVLVGTTALFGLLRRQQPNWSPDLLVIDEQQKLSRDQRETILGAATNLLEVTATCIPRTAALVTHGVWDVSIIRECPVEKRIHTAIVTASQKLEMFDAIKGHIREGGQVAVIYHMVDGDKEGGRHSVEAAFPLWSRQFPGRVAMLHGKMSAAEKSEILARMKAGAFDVLICSTVIEVGVTIPSLKAAVVVHAERHGVTTLHQMRGRVARLGGDGFFYLYLPDPVPEESLSRLRLVAEHADGFTLAERDMYQRGFGDLGGASERQTGGAGSLFLNLDLMPQDVERFVKSLGPAH